MEIEVKSKAMLAGEDDGASRHALHFVRLIGVLSLFADFTYEGARSILGPYLASLHPTVSVNLALVYGGHGRLGR